MKLIEFLEKEFEHIPIGMLDATKKMIELEAIDNFFNLMYGVELEINIIPVEPKAGKFFSKAIAEKAKDLQKKINFLSN